MANWSPPRLFFSDPSGDGLTLAADDAEIAADGTDATRLSFRVVDRYGAPRPYVTGNVTLDVDGPGVLIGDNPFDLAAAGGVGAAWLRSLPGSSGLVTVTATHPALSTAIDSVLVRADLNLEPPPGGLTGSGGQPQPG